MKADEEQQHNEGGGQQAGGVRPASLHGLPVQVFMSPTSHTFLTTFLPIVFDQVKNIRRLTKPPVAQLTRVHVVTPKAPVYVTLNPQVCRL